MLRVNYNELEGMPYPSPWGGGQWSYNGVPFTGVAYVEDDQTGIVLSETSYIDGYEEGLETDYWDNGNKKEECYNKDDFIYGDHKKWDQQGNLIYHVEHDDFGNKLRIVKHPNPALEE